ncbi:MAG: LysR family transcriptional regulator [Alphaproteobacteria bacterium]|nr:LysR family transcriptional regulator [Alphaproteobacteria bacterium]
MSEQSVHLDNWNEVHTAYHVARLGTLSAAAKFLGVHHATVIRHIDTLEARLGARLFYRHARGYTATEAGQELMRVAAATEDQLTQLAGRLRGRSETVSGDLIITTISGLSPRLTPLFVRFQARYPEVRVTLVADERRLRLEYGEAHLAIRAGSRPQEPDNVVQKLVTIPTTLFAHKDYVAKFGMLENGNYGAHRFVSSDVDIPVVGFYDWFKRNVPPEAIYYRASQMRSIEDAIHAGAGIGFLTEWSGNSNPDLVEMMAPKPEWGFRLWLVTHVDMHRTAKVQALLRFMKEFLQHLPHLPHLPDCDRRN